MRRLFCLLCLIVCAASPPAAFGALQPSPTGYLVATAHLDTQWRWTIQDTITEFIPATLRRNFELLDEFPTYEFNFEGAFRYMLAKEYYPEDYERLRAYIELGRWHVCGSMVESLDVNVPSPESLIRQVLYGNGFFEQEFGTTSCDVFLPDCFGFTYALPTVAAHGGLKGFSTQKLTWGSAFGIPFDVGVWEGVDGSSVVAALNAGSYTTRLEGDMSADAGWLERINKTGELSGVYVGYKYFGTGDTGGAPDAASVEWAGKSLHGRGPIHVVNGAADQLFHDLTPEQVAALPRYRGELLMTRHGTGCYTSQCAMKRWNRRNELLADAAERACVAADVLGGARYPKEKLREAWIRFLWHQFHDDLTGTSIPEVYRFSWNDEVLSLNQFGAELRNAAGAVAQSLDTRVAGIPLIVYNPLAFEREDVVEAAVRFDGPAPKSVQVFDPQGKPVPTQVVGTDGEIVSLLFLARVDSVGFSVFDVRAADAPAAQPSRLTASATRLENERYRVSLDEQGDVCSVYDKRLGRELLAGPLRLQLLRDRLDVFPEWEISYENIAAPPFACVGAPARIAVVEQGPVRAAVEMTRTAGGSTFVQRISVAAGAAGDRLEFETLIDWHTRGTLLKAVFPITASNPAATYDLGCGTVERPNNTARLYEVPAQQWADLTDTSGTFGVAVLNDCKYGWDKPDDSTLRLTLIHQPVGVTKDTGWHEMKWALCGHRGDWRQDNVPCCAARLNQPLMVFQTAKHDGPLGRAFSLLKLDSSQVCVRALKLAEHSDEIVVRLQEAWGRPVSAVEASLGCPITSARELNGAEKNLRPLDFDDRTVSLDFAQYQIRTIALQPRRPASSVLPVTRPVKLPFNADVVSSDRNRADGDFAGTGHGLPAELLPPIVVSSGIPFHLGPSADGRPNAVVCRGQTVALPGGQFSHLYILAAANGTQTGTFTLGATRRTLRIHDFSGWIGQADNMAAQGAGGLAEGARPGFIVPDEVAWAGTHRHDARRDRNEPYVFCYLFKYAIELPPGATSVVLPDNERIVIAAMAAADNPSEHTVAAQPLHDDLRAVRIEPPATIFIEPISVQLATEEPGAAIAYTLDGTVPTLDSPRYGSPIQVTRTCALTARVVSNGTLGKRLARAAFTLVQPRPALDVAGLVPGLAYRYYEGGWRTLPDFDSLEPAASGSVDTFDLRVATSAEDYGLVFDGFIDVARTGVYTFQIASDDGSKLYVDGEQVADNDGAHPRCTASGRIALARGFHRIRVAFFQSNGDRSLSVRYAGPGIEDQPIPSSALYRKAE
jgi:alpha-mannosidase